MIRAEELTFDYERLDEEGNVESKKRAVDHVNLHIRPGKFIAVLGHNGSGKSTLAKHINAILMPAEGTLWVDGMDTKEEGKLWSIRQEAGMVFLLLHPAVHNRTSVLLPVSWSVTSYLCSVCSLQKTT